MANVAVTSNAIFGDHVCVLPNTVIHQDVQLESWALVGLGSNVIRTVEKGTRVVGNPARILPK